jgi:rare lipoprotein A
MILNKRIIAVAMAVLVAMLLSSCATGNAKIASRQGYERFPEKQQTTSGKKTAAIGTTFEGEASYYGPGFDGKKTASGEIFNQNDMTCAHKKLPFGTILEVVRKDTGAKVRVRVNDRGPFVKDRILDLSVAAGKKLGLDKVGHAKVVATVVE